MRQMIVIDSDSVTSAAVEATLDADNLDKSSVLTARLGQQGLELSRSRRHALVLCELQLPDMSGLEVLQEIKRMQTDTPVVVVAASGTIRDAVSAMRLGALDFIPKPLTSTDLRKVADLAAHMEYRDGTSLDDEQPLEAHAGSRWARAVAPIAFAKRDPRTTEGWSREVYASPGTLRNWCRTAGVTTRRSLAFGRLLRAVHLCRDHAQKPENVLDIVDLRTLAKLLRSAGLTPGAELPRTIGEFLDKQKLITDQLLVREIGTALASAYESTAAATAVAVS